MPSILTEPSIDLDHPVGVYIPGAAVTGLIKFKLAESVNIPSVMVRVVGNSRLACKNRFFKTANTEQEEDGIISTIFMNILECVPLSSPGTKMDAGEHTLPFSICLPKNIPSSIELPQGSIRYKIVVTTNGIPGVSRNFEKLFSVCQLCDLNAYPEAKLPGQTFKNKKKFICISLNSLEASLFIDRSGVVPGEQLNINARIINHSSKIIHYTKISLIQKVCFLDSLSKRYVLKVKRTVTDSTRGSLKAGSMQVWQNESMTVPAIPPSTKDCYNWSIKYYLQMDLFASSERKSHRLKIPLIVGNVPIEELYPLCDFSSQNFLSSNESWFTCENCTFESNAGDGLYKFVPKYYMLHPATTEIANCTL